MEDAAAVAILEALLALDANAEQARERVDGDAADGRPAHGGVIEGAVALDQEEPVIGRLGIHVGVVGQIEVLERLDSLGQRQIPDRGLDLGHALVGNALEHALRGVGAELVRHGVEDGDVQGIVVLREEVVAGLGEGVSRGRTAGAAPLVRAAVDLGVDPAVALELEELLADGLAGELEEIRQLGDGGRPLLLERDEDGPPAVGKLVDGKDGASFDSYANRMVSPIIQDSQRGTWIGTATLSIAAVRK